jgi:quinoprotein glucose dehydrogenase
VVYVPLGAPAWDRYGGDRKGANLFGTSVVALNAKTGERLWHYQVVHHDIWDFDLEAPPTLFDVKKDGKTIPAVGIVSKSGLMFILDRVTGKPVYPVEERAVPKSDVPDEEAWPTQPFPSAPPPISRITMSRAELADVTPEHKAFCEKLVDANNINLGGPYPAGRRNRTTVNFPGTIGGANWGGGAFDPTTAISSSTPSTWARCSRSCPTRRPAALPHEPAVRPVLGAQGPPALPEAAVGQAGGRRRQQGRSPGKACWASPTACPRRCRRPAGPAWAVRSSPPAAWLHRRTDDNRFRAFDAKTGAELWSTKLDASGHATPMTYVGKDGRQYVLIVSTGGTFLDSPLTSDAVTAFALPQ